MNKFYDLNLYKDKSKSSSTHKSMYFNEPGKINLTIDEIFSQKKFFSEPTDLEIIDKIIAGIKKTIYLLLGLYKKNFFLKI